jgi:hypothetical protein
MAYEVGTFFESDEPARLLPAKLCHPGKTRNGNCEVAPFRHYLAVYPPSTSQLAPVT